MTFRGDADAVAAHLAEETRGLERARRERDQKKQALAALKQRATDLDAAILSRRGSALNGRGYVRLSALGLVMLAAGWLHHQVQETNRYAGWAVLAAMVTVLTVSFWRAHRRAKVAKKLLEEHDARVEASKKAPPPTRASSELAEDAAEPASARTERANTRV